MYAGRIVEYGGTSELFRNPLHPYTRGLIDSLPQNSPPGMPLKTIPGQVPERLSELAGCGFCDRCPEKEWRCMEEKPEMKEIGPGHLVRCWKYR
jgi:peptide/nickel transport system ATP-binding protein